MNGFYDREKRELICVTEKQEIYDLLEQTFESLVWLGKGLIWLVELYQRADVLADWRGEGALQHRFDDARNMARRLLIFEDVERSFDQGILQQEFDLTRLIAEERLVDEL